MSLAPDKYCVVGSPIAHSRSPEIHARFAEQTGQDLQYARHRVEPGHLGAFVRGFVGDGGRGLNVTVPLKAEAWSLVDVRDQDAEIAGAVNTIVVEPDGRLRGLNTDGAGLVTDLLDRHGVTLTDKTIVLVGAGGASQGVLLPLLAQRPRYLCIANRTAARAEQLAQHFEAHRRNTVLAAMGLSELDTLRVRPDLVINATSAALGADGGPVDLPGAVVRDAFCYDMSYGDNAAFQRWARAAGAVRAVDGLGMLVEQAALSFTAWRGVRPDTESVYRDLAKIIATNAAGTN